MNDNAKNRIEEQLSELELLMSMYPNKGELEFDDAAELADLRAALDSDNVVTYVSGVGFTLHLSAAQVCWISSEYQQSAMKCNGCRQCLYIRILLSITVLLTMYFLVCTQICLRFRLSQKSNHT